MAKVVQTNKRTLPAWMLGGEAKAPQVPKPKPAPKRKKASQEDEEDVAEEKPQQKRPQSSATSTKEVKPAEQAKAKEEDTSINRKDHEVKQSVPANPTKPHDSKPVDNLELEATEPESEGETAPQPSKKRAMNPAVNATTNHTKANNKQPAKVPNKKSVAAAKKPRLPMCQYGKQCYRKNPVHFQEYAHPGGTFQLNDY
eukprot:Colp12_sorted_trinity150504_noHs@913